MVENIIEIQGNKINTEFQPSDAQYGLGDYCKEAKIQTPKASIYLQKMCKHFTHRVPAHWNQTKSKVFFDMGWCFMTASDQELFVRCEANNTHDLDEILETLKSHFDRFALKEQLVLNWL